MKVRKLFYLSVWPAVVALCGCVIPSSVQVASSSCPPMPEMSAGETVSYLVSYDSGISHVQKISQISVDGSGNYFSLMADGAGENVVGKAELCSGDGLPYSSKGLSDEQVFLLFVGARLAPKSNVAGSTDGNDARPPTQYKETTCETAEITVKAGDFSVSACTAISVDGKESIKSYYMVKSQVESSPLNGLVKYDFRNDAGSVSVELIEWNGL